MIKLLSTDSCNEIKEWKYGFGFDKEGRLRYYDPNINEKSEFVITYFTKTDKEILKNEGNLIIADSIRIYDDWISIINANKEKRGLIAGGGEIYHKVENCRNWVSKDGKNWEVLEIKYLKETQEKNWVGEPLILVYFKCSYFEGEYYITSRL